MKKLVKFLNSDISQLFKWYNQEFEEGFVYLSLYFFIIYIKNTEIHDISFAEKMQGFYVGKYFVRIIY